MHQKFDYWLVKGFFDGGLVIPKGNDPLPIEGATLKLTEYCKLTLKIGTKRYGKRPNFELKIKVSKSTDYNTVIRYVYDFCEEILTAIVFVMKVSVSLIGIHMNKVIPRKEDAKNYVLIDYQYDEAEEWSPYLHAQKRGNLVSTGGISRSLKALKQSHAEEIQKYIGLFNNANDLVLKAVDFYKRGIKLENYWENESFLCFYKAIELFIDAEYKNKYKEHVRSKIREDFSLLMKKTNLKIGKDQTKEIFNKFLEMDNVLTNRGLFEFICKTTNFPNFRENEENIMDLTSIRGSIAHPPRRSAKKGKDDTFTYLNSNQLRVCKNLAKHLIMKNLTTFQ